MGPIWPIALGAIVLWLALRRGKSVRAELEYLTVTQTGLPNDPPESVWPALEILHNVVKGLQHKYGPIAIQSAYRSPEVNRAVGGVASSLHLDGRALDFRPLEIDAGELYAEWLKDKSRIAGVISKVILYEREDAPRWMHIEIPRPGSAPEPKFYRRQRTG